MRPRAILLTGAPGTGKSTLGRKLAEAVRIPFIARDDVRGGLAFTWGAWSDELERLPSAGESVEVFLNVVEGLLARGVSCVVEYVVRSHRPVDLERLLAAGDTVVIFTECVDPVARLIARNETDRLVANPAVLRAAGASTVSEHTAAMIERMRLVELEMMRTFPVPVMHVDTTGPYDPAFETLLTFATSRP